MQSLNVLIVGDGISLNNINFSKYLKKIYITSENTIPNCINIKYNTFQELAIKCKALQIDLVIAEDEKLIFQGIGDVMKKNFINCIAPTAKWTELALNRAFSRGLLKQYKIDIPKTIMLPIEFPVMVKANHFSKQANNLQEIINIKQEIYDYSQEMAQSVYIEEFINGEKQTIISLYDGKNLLTFPNQNIKTDLLNKYSNKLQNMLNSQNADFVGFINTKAIITDKKLYNMGFSFEYESLPKEFDLLYIFLSAIYQKLNEIKL